VGKSSSRVMPTLFKIEDREVVLDDKGRFVVTLASGETLKAQSMIALKVKVDKTKGIASFPILTYDRYRYRNEHKGPFETATVVGLHKARGYYPPEFRTADGKHYHEVVIDNPANRAKLRKIRVLRNRELTIEEKVKAIEQTLEKRNTRSGVQGLV
jgi:hypothetical protein